MREKLMLFQTVNAAHPFQRHPVPFFHLHRHRSFGKAPFFNITKMLMGKVVSLIKAGRKQQYEDTPTQNKSQGGNFPAYVKHFV
jgi:hypothetical protein